MRGGGRPPSVRRHLHRPLWLAGAATAAVLLVAGLDARAAARHDRRLDAGLRATGTVEEVSAGRTVQVAYTNAVTGQRISLPVEVWGAPVPAPGDTVALDVAREDPEEVVLGGDRRPATAELWWYLPLPAIPLALWALRARDQRRLERLIASDDTTFAMVGALSPPRRLSRRCELSLYPLDAGPRSEPVATVALLSTAGLAVGDTAFPVEVKGSPRPLGVVAARAHDRVLWPAGRALSVTARPRPATVGPPAAPPPAEPDDRLRATVPRTGPGNLGAEIGAVALALALVVVVSVVTLARRGDATQLARTGTPVVVEVVERVPTGVTVTYETGAGTVAEARAPVAFPGDYTVGRRYPAHVGPGDDPDLRLDREPYDAATPIGWAAIPAAAALAVVVRRRWAAWNVRRRARSGPFVAAEAIPDGAGGLRLCPPGVAHELCRVPLAPPGRCRAGPVVAAGSVEPGGWVAVGQDGRWLDVSGRALPPVTPQARPALWPWRSPRWRRFGTAT